ncbi:MAG: acyl-CoA dehydrogenase family protein [Nitrospinae bacterium]|nr:acyl-CoA dehydrogenase family protein [Nitrospinota bacterium]
MHFQFTELQTSVQRMMKEFVDREIMPIAMEYELADKYPTPIVEKMQELGFFGFTIPEEYGGSGMDEVCYAIAMEELSVGWMSVAGILGTHMMTAWMILNYGTDEQKKTYLPKMATGEWHSGMALTEPGSGSDAAALKTRAVREDDQWVMNGSKMFISNAEHGTMFSVFARTDPEKSKAKGISCILVHKGTPGFQVSRHLKKMGYRGIRTSELVFEDARVPLENLLGQENEGFPMIMSGLEGGRVNVAARSVGLARAAFEDSMRYSQQRETFGKPLAGHQLIQAKLAEMGTRIHAAKLMTYHAANLKAQGKRCDLEAGMAKFFASETAEFCASEAIQVHGGMGYIQELPVERYFRDSKLLVVGEGSNEIQRLIIAKRLLEQYPA